MLDDATRAIGDEHPSFRRNFLVKRRKLSTTK